MPRDPVAVEEPLEIRVEGEAQAVLMRTPGDDFDLAVGFAVTERLVPAPVAVASVHWGDPADFNVVDLHLAPGVPRPRSNRRTVANAACGVCGKAHIEDVHLHADPVTGDRTSVPIGTLLTLPERLRREQRVFDATGGVHAAGLFEPSRGLIAAREDIGRHNAVDKVLGALAREDALPARGLVMQVSGRAGFEIVQKAAVAGVPVVASVSAPSSLAIDLAEETGITLAGFVRGDSCNVYTHAWRIR